MIAVKTGRPALTSRAELLQAAREIGFKDLTIGRITDRVGVGYSTAYRHISSFEDLLAELVDLVLSDLSIPDTESWRDHLLAVADALSQLLTANPGLVRALESVPVPHRLTDLRRCAVDVLLDAGFLVTDAGLAVDAVIALALSSSPVDVRAVVLVADGLAARLPGGAG